MIGNVPDRQIVRVQLPCPRCVHEGVCTIQEQIESDLVLTVIGVGRPVDLALDCSIYERAPEPEILRREMKRHERARPGRRRMSEGARRRWEEGRRVPDRDG